jgi:hypothetical protein
MPALSRPALLPRARLLIVGVLCAFAARGAPAEPPPTLALPATGQINRYTADRDDGHTEPVPVSDDGHVRAGAPLHYRDNGDGTVTDLNTGLMWEKKCSGCTGLHNVRERYRWSGDGKLETVWDWLRQVNAEGEKGVAGYSDWRIPNVNELVSVVDYGKRLPSVSSEFRGDLCASECLDLMQPGCSCTEIGEYWSSTTFADFPAHALAVFFGMGLVNDRIKTAPAHVRAVRGGD